MKKEIIGVIFFGFILGLVVVLGLRTANTSLKKAAATPSDTISTTTEEKKVTTPDELTLTLALPQDGEVTNQEKIAVKGKVSNQVVIAIVYPDGEKIIESDKEGNFQAEVTLVGGDNEIKTVAYDKQGKQTDQAINIIYSTAQVLIPTIAPTAVPTQEASRDNIQEIRDAVKEKVKEKIIARQVRGLAGIVDDLTESAMTVKNKKGLTTVTLTTETKIITKEKLKVAAYVVVIGIQEDEAKLDAKRVVVALAPKISEKSVVAGKVIDTSPIEQLLTLKNEKGGTVVTLEVKDEAKFTKIKIGDWIVAVGLPAKDDELFVTAKTLWIATI